MLTQSEIDKYKEEMEARRSKLVAEIEKDSKPTDFGSDVTDALEQEADEAEEFSNQLAIAQTMREEVQEIDSAMERIRENTYGTCSKCGGEISKEVLDAAPESSLCESCKQEV